MKKKQIKNVGVKWKEFSLKHNNHKESLSHHPILNPHTPSFHIFAQSSFQIYFHLCSNKYKLRHLYIVFIVISTHMNQSTPFTNIYTSKTYSQITKRQQQIKDLILLSKDFQIIKKYTEILEEKIQIEKRGLLNEQIACTKGRGGNNIAENIKKSILSIIKKKLPSHIFSHLQKQCIEKHQLKSQKENIIIFFLYLHKYQTEGRIQYKAIEEITEMMKGKIMKYIENSKDKMKFQVERREFHEKNIVEFQKFLKIDLKFNQKRSFAQITHHLQGFYIRKKVQFNKAIHRLTKVIQSQPFLKTFFHDLSSDTIKQEQISQTSTQKSNPQADSQLMNE